MNKSFEKEKLYLNTSLSEAINVQVDPMTRDYRSGIGGLLQPFHHDIEPRPRLHLLATLHLHLSR